MRHTFQFSFTELIVSSALHLLTGMPQVIPELQNELRVLHEDLKDLRNKEQDVQHTNGTHVARGESRYTWLLCAHIVAKPVLNAR